VNSERAIIFSKHDSQVEGQPGDNGIRFAASDRGRTTGRLRGRPPILPLFGWQRLINIAGNLQDVFAVTPLAGARSLRFSGFVKQYPRSREWRVAIHY